MRFFGLSDSTRQSSGIEPVGTSADLFQNGGSDSGAAEEFVDGVEEGPGTLGVNDDVAVEFASCSEGFFFASRDLIFEPVPVGGHVIAENEAGLAIRVVTIPTGIAEGLVDAVSVKAAHEGLYGHAWSGWGGTGVGPGSEPAAVVESAEDGEVGDDARTQIEAGTGQDLGDDGVVDVDVESDCSRQAREPQSLQITGFKSFARWLR